MTRIKVTQLLLAASLSGSLALGADFSGNWQQEPAKSVPPTKSKRVRQMKIEQSGQKLTVTQMSNMGQGVSDVSVTYEIGGKEVVFTGLDGDEFHTKVREEGESLIFETTEVEAGKQIPSKQTWTLEDGGKELREVKQVKGTERTSVFAKQ